MYMCVYQMVGESSSNREDTGTRETEKVTG